MAGPFCSCSNKMSSCSSPSSHMAWKEHHVILVLLLEESHNFFYEHASIFFFAHRENHMTRWTIVHLVCHLLLIAPLSGIALLCVLPVSVDKHRFIRSWDKMKLHFQASLMGLSSQPNSIPACLPILHLPYCFNLCNCWKGNAPCIAVIITHVA